MRSQELDGRLEMLLEHCREFVALADPEGRLIQEWSPVRTRSLGYEPNELQGANLLDYVHPEDLPGVRAAFRGVLAASNATAVFSCRIRAKDQGWRYLEGTLTNRMNEPLLAGVVINWRDVTEQRQCQRTAAEAEHLLARLFEEAPIGMLIATMDRVIRRVNLAFCSSLGYTREELLNIDTHSLVHPDDYEKVLSQAKRVQAGELPVLRTEARFQGKHGRTVWMDVCAFYMRDEDGRPERVVGVLRDITREKEMIAELEASRERIRELANFAVEARDQERASMAREIHDELGQLLTALMMGLEQLRRDHLPDCPKREAMSSRIDHLLELIRYSLQWVRRMTVELRPDILTHLGLVEAIAWQAERFEQDTGIHCHLDLPLAEVELAPSQATTVFRVFQEALTNIARHSRAQRVDVRLYEVGDRVVFTIRDNGKGLPPELRFGPLSVGLVGMQERVAQHGGRLRFFSKPGVGTATTLRLPKILPKHLDISNNL